MPPFPSTPPSSSEDINPEPSRTTQKSRVSKERSPRTTLLSSPPKFKWNKQHRLVLMLCHDYKLGNTDTRRYFNAKFRDDWVASGFPDGIGQGALHSQWQERKKPTCQSWKEVMNHGDNAELQILREDITAWQQKDNGNESRDKGTRATLSTQVEKRRTQDNPPNLATKTFTLTATRRPNSLRGWPEERHISINRTRRINNKEILVINPDDPYCEINWSEFIPQNQAHPPLSEVLFRYYHEGIPDASGSTRESASQGYNAGRKGFLSAKFMSLTGRAPHPLPFDSSHLATTILSHTTGTRLTSELISVTSDFYFVLRMAQKKVAEGANNVRISIIRGSVLQRPDGVNPRVYHAKPYYQYYKAHKLYLGNTYKNPASHEYLVWANIPSTAVLHDIALENLERHVLSIPSVHIALRFDDLKRHDVNNINMQKLYSKYPVTLTMELTTGLARFLPLIGIKCDCAAAVIAKVVAEFIRGWRIRLPTQNGNEWEFLGNLFAFTLSYHSGARTAHGEQQQQLRNTQAFLSGLCSGLGVANWHVDMEKQQAMQRRANKHGLAISASRASAIEASTDENSAGLVLRTNAGDGEDDEQEEQDQDKDDDYHGDEQDDDEVMLQSAPLEDFVNKRNKRHVKNYRNRQSRPWRGRGVQPQQEETSEGRNGNNLWTRENTIMIDAAAEDEIFYISDYDDEEEEEEEYDGSEEDSSVYEL